MRVAAWAAILATVELAILTRGDIPTPTATEGAAIAYLAVITTALAFVLWFGAVQQLGAAKAGLLVGFMPIAAVTVDAVLNGAAPSTADIAGTALVAAGIAFGAMPPRARLRGENAGSGARFLRDRCRDPQRGPTNVGQRSDDAWAAEARSFLWSTKGRAVSLNVGIGLALLCAAITQLGFLCKHRGATQAPRVDSARAAAQRP